MSLDIYQFPCRSDNFGILLRTNTGHVALVDAPEENAILKAVEHTGWSPQLILNTHHHADHVEANLVLKERFGLKIAGPRAEAVKIPGIDVLLDDGDVFDFHGEPVRVISTPGHTAGHVSFHFPRSSTAFTGDTLFALGCGRLFECGPEAMFQSLERLAALPAETEVYCGHEYTLANARFALTIDPDNKQLVERARKFDVLRVQGLATLPTTIADELATNPFLRSGDPAIRRTLGLEDASDSEVFAEMRRHKDHF